MALKLCIEYSSHFFVEITKVLYVTVTEIYDTPAISFCKLF